LTGDQIWVLVETRQAKRILEGEISRWNDAHVVMTQWGEVVSAYEGGAFSVTDTVGCRPSENYFVIAG
jgi:hypothetical protein